MYEQNTKMKKHVSVIPNLQTNSCLTNLPLVPSNQISIGSDNGSSPIRRQAIF